MIAALLLGAGALAGQAPPDSIPRVTLAEALAAATRLDPDYVRALGQVDNAEWGRRAALATFIVPSIDATLDATKYSTDFFNIGTGQLQDQAINAEFTARYELFSVRKFSELGRTRAELESAEAGQVRQRFRTALATETDYYQVLRDQELSRVAAERVRRAEEAYGVARARVLSGAAVQTDSLQLQLELTQARVDRLRQDAALRVARLQLGRRVGTAGPVDAAPGDTAAAPDLPIALADAVRLALDQGPQYQAARATERSANARVRAERGDYLPQVTVGASHLRFDDSFFPGARNVSALTFRVTYPLWNNGQREIALSQARVDRDVARAIRQDLERSAQRDVTEAYDAYATAQASEALSGTAVLVARENYRVQRSRYEAGASTILDLLDAQLRLTQTEAELVQARYASRLALAGLEAMLGRRLFTNKGAP